MMIALRKRLSYVAAGLLVAVALSGCEIGPAPFAPKTADSATGYTDEQLAQNRFRVTFTGNSQTPREAIEDDLLLRAAQVTQAAGAQWFMFAERDTKAKTRYISTFDDMPGWHRPFGWYGWGGWPDEADTRPITHYMAYAEIVTLTQAQAKADPRSLNAQDVIDHLAPKVLPPPPH
jgi:hypothetical protein